MSEFRKETDSLGEVAVPADRLWRAQTQRSREHFSIGKDLIPRAMITAAALELGFVSEAAFDCIVDPARLVTPYVATGRWKFTVKRGL